MLVVTFAVAGAGNCAEVAGTPYVYARTEFGSFVMPARCRHRGGPLHLGTFDGDGGRLVCPWHERATRVAGLATRGVPAVRRGDTVTAVFPHTGDHALTYRPLSAPLSVTRRPAATGGCGQPGAARPGGCGEDADPRPTATSDHPPGVRS